MWSRWLCFLRNGSRRYRFRKLGNVRELYWDSRFGYLFYVDINGKEDDR